MNTIDYIQRQFDNLRRMSRATLKDLTGDQLNWTPPGLANKIGVTLLHSVGGEDMFVQSILQGKPTLWDSQNWSARIGVANPPGGPDETTWEESRRATLSLAPILAYQQAVVAATVAYLFALTSQELDRTVKLFGSDHPAADVLVLLESHVTGHLGEIAALKGIQGAKGLPF